MANDILPPLETGDPAPHFSAFISYSHTDAKAARRLHRQLERFRLPRHLAQASPGSLTAAQRLRPLFRDIDELPAAQDLSAQIKAALASSAALIVLASPAAQASHWVNREIETFRALHGDTRPILVALLDGAPDAAFPPALRAAGLEPVAADFRKGGDGQRLALLKLVAGLTGLRLDSLVQRDSQARLRRVTAITVGALIAMVIMAGLLVITLRARAEADRQRNEAEGLVEYMLTDLREKLKGVGRLEVMTGVNQRALAYYGDQRRQRDLPLDSKLRIARFLHAMGEDDLRRSNFALARQKLAQAHGITAAQLQLAPANPDVVFAHAQSEYWLGDLAWQRNDRGETTRRWQAYSRLAHALEEIEPNSVRALTEQGYAYGNLCELNDRDSFNQSAAITYCAKAVERMHAAALRSGQDAKVNSALANRHGWLARLYEKVGRMAEAMQQRSAEQAILVRLAQADPASADLAERLTWNRMGMAGLYVARGDPGTAIVTYRQAELELRRLITRDPDHTGYPQLLAQCLMDRAALLKKSGANTWRNDLAEARRLILLLMDQAEDKDIFKRLLADINLRYEESGTWQFQRKQH